MGSPSPDTLVGVSRGGGGLKSPLGSVSDIHLDKLLKHMYQSLNSAIMIVSKTSSEDLVTLKTS